MHPSEQELARAVTLRARGLSLEQVAQELGLPRGLVGRWLRGRGRVRSCRYCGRAFASNNGRQRFCSPEHRAAYYDRAPVMRGCRLCGEPFQPASHRQFYCRPAHQQQNVARRRTPVTLDGWRERIAVLEAELAHVRARLGEPEDLA